MIKDVVFLPAVMTDGRMYEAQVKALKELNYNIHIFVNKDFTNITDFANSIIQNTCQPCAVIGTSMGGYVAMEIMRQAPNLVRKLCLLNTTYKADTKEKTQDRLKLIEYYSNITDKKQLNLDNNTLSHYLHNITKENSLLVNSMIQDLGVNTILNQLHMIMSRKSYEEDFQQYSVDTLFIAGDKDNLTPVSVMQEMCGAVQNGQIVVLKDCSHLSPIDQPNEVTKVITDWIGE